MGRTRTPGLVCIKGIWHIDKRIKGYGRLCQSTGESARAAAERFLARRVEEIRAATVYGVRPRRIWREAATHYLDTVTKRSLARDAQDLEALDPFIGTQGLHSIHMGTLRPFIEARRRQGCRTATINRSLAVVRRVLNLASRLWRDEHGLSWLEVPPMIVLEKGEARRAYPLTWEEQSRLLRALPGHLQRMALFKVNTGTREQEVCGLRWAWEVPVPELSTSVFIIPGDRVKNAEDRLVVLNAVASRVVEEMRGQHEEFVFPYRGRPVLSMENTAWRRAWRAAGLPVDPDVIRGVHNLKHTFGRRLRAAGVSQETRKVLLGHKDGDVTTHYSAPELRELIEAANRVATDSRKTPELVVLRRA